MKKKKTTNRVAPAGGYDFGNKRQYRRVVWKRAAEFLTHRRKSAHVLLMPSLEGDEIDVALSKGFCQQNMHVVDGNPAIVATLKRRYPYIQTYGVDIVRACKRIADKGTKLSFANFDFCTHSEGAREILFQLRAFEADLFASAHMLAITVQRGREREMALKKEMYREAIEHFDKWDNHYLARGGRQETLEKDPWRWMSREDHARYEEVFVPLCTETWSYMASEAPMAYKSNVVTMMYFVVTRTQSPDQLKERVWDVITHKQGTPRPRGATPRGVYRQAFKVGDPWYDKIQRK